MLSANAIYQTLHPRSAPDRALIRFFLAVLAGFVGFLVYIQTHWCTAGVPWIEENAFLLGPPLCFLSVVCIRRYRHACLAVLVVLAIWPLYLEVIH